MRVELSDKTPHHSTVYTSGPAGRNAAVIADDGVLVQVYNDLAGHVYVRPVTDPTQPAWGAWTALSSAANTSGVVTIVRLVDRLRVLWQGGATTNALVYDSSDNGVSWGAAAVLFDAGGFVAGLACDANVTPIFVLYEATVNAWRVATWSLGAGSWLQADWGNGDSYDGGGIGVLQGEDGAYRVAVVLQASATTGMALQVCTYGGSGWSAPDVLVPDDLGAGLTLYDPRLAHYGGQWHLPYALIDSGVVSGRAGTRVAVAHSVDGMRWGMHWTDPLEDANSYRYGAVALKHAVGYLLVAPDVSALAPVYTGSPGQYLDCTADVAELQVTQQAGQPAALTLRLQNEAAQYAELAVLRPNARVRVWLGYVGVGVVPTHLVYVDSYQYTSAVDQKDVVIVARDGLAWLERESRTTLVYQNRTLDWLTREVLARAGLLTVQLPTTAQFSETVPLFSIPAGTTWRRALDRLSRVYGYDMVARTQPDGTDLIAVVELSLTDEPACAYGDEADTLQVVINGLSAGRWKEQRIICP